MRRHRTNILIGIATVMTGGPLVADDVYLTDGRVLEGEVTSRPESPVVDLVCGSGSMVAIQHLERAKVLKIVYGTSIRETRLRELRERQTALGSSGTADDWWQLSQRAKELGDSLMAKECAQQTVARDRGHAEARKTLGMVSYNGVWMQPNEIAAARGQVLFRGQWVDWPTREALLEDEARRRDEAAAARKARDDQRRASAYQAAAEAESISPYPPTVLTNDPGYLVPNPYFYRSTYWPILANPGYCAPGAVVNIHASGGGGNHSWSFNWRF